MARFSFAFVSRQFLFLLLLLLFASGTYLWRINDKSVDFDERYSLNIATGLGGETGGKRTFGAFVENPLPGEAFTPADYWQRFTYTNTVNTALSDNGQGMPYLLLLHNWLSLAPVTVFNARLPAVLFLVLAGGLLGVFLFRNAGIAPALLATTLLLFNGLLMDLARYIRFYTMGVFWAVLSGIFLYRLAKYRRPADAFGLGSVWAFFLLTQYFAALVILGQAAYLLFYQRKKLRFPVWISGVSGFLSILLIWIFPLKGIEALTSVLRYSGASAGSPTAWFPGLTFSGTLTGLAANLATVLGAATNSTPGFKTAFNIALALPGWLLCFQVLRQPLSSFQKNAVRVAALVIATQFCFVAGHLLLTGKGLLLVPRYWLFCIPFGAVWLAIAFQNALGQKGFWKGIALLAVVALGLRMGLSVYTAWSGKSFSGFRQPTCLQAALTPDLEGMAADIRQRWHPGDTVVYASWPFAQYLNWFLRESPPITQQVDTTQEAFSVLKTPSGTVALPLRLGQPLKARPCP